MRIEYGPSGGVTSPVSRSMTVQPVATTKYVPAVRTLACSVDSSSSPKPGKVTRLPSASTSSARGSSCPAVRRMRTSTRSPARRSSRYRSTSSCGGWSGRTGASPSTPVVRMPARWSEIPVSRAVSKLPSSSVFGGTSCTLPAASRSAARDPDRSRAGLPPDRALGPASGCAVCSVSLRPRVRGASASCATSGATGSAAAAEVRAAALRLPAARHQPPQSWVRGSATSDSEGSVP